MQSLKQTTIVALIIAASLFLFLKDLKLVSATYDEDFSYLRNSIYLVHNFLWDQPYINLHPPLMYYAHGWPFLFLNPTNPAENLFLARIAILPIFVGFAISLFLLIKKKINETSAYVFLILYSFSIEILAHARLVTADYLQAITIFAAIISFYNFLKKTENSSIAMSSFFLGLALISKYSALLLIPIFGLLFLIFQAKGKCLFRNAAKLFFIFLVAVFIVHASYLFKETGKLPKDFKNKYLTAVSNSPIKYSLFLLPRSYISGVDLQVNSSQGIWWGYFAGKQYYQGLWYFYLLAFLLKTQIPLLLLTAAVIVYKIKKRKIGRLDFILLSFIIYFFVYFSFFNKLIIGLRYLLMVYPLIFFYIAKNVSFIKNKLAILLFSFLLLIYMSQAFWISPHFLSYTNELTGGPTNAYKYFADSNLDWNQNSIFFQNYLATHPEITAINPHKPKAGLIAVNVNDMNLYYWQDYQWLRDLKKEPVANVGYTWLIYSVNESEVTKN